MAAGYSESARFIFHTAIQKNGIVILLTLGYLCIFSFICASLRDLVISGASSNNFLKGTSEKETRRGYNQTSCEIKSSPQESTGGKMSTKCFVLYPDSCVAVHVCAYVRACTRVGGSRRIAVVCLIPPSVIAVIDTVVA